MWVFLSVGQVGVGLENKSKIVIKAVIIIRRFGRIIEVMA